jgi:hypothetical protein
VDADQPPHLRFADLTAGELWLLRYTTVARPGPEALKLGLQELVMGGALRVVPVRARRRRQPMLVAGPRFHAPVAAALAPLVALHAGARPRRGATAGGEECEGILIDAFARAAKRAFRGAHGYGEHAVAGVLEDRGLLEVRRRPGGRPHFTRTAAGDAVEAQLDEWLRGARPDATSAHLRQGGAAGLLVHHIHPELGALERLVKLPDPATPVDPGVSVVRWDESGVQDGLAGIDDLFAALAWIDLGFPGGGGGGGGDGGGGGGDGGG